MKKNISYIYDVNFYNTGYSEFETNFSNNDFENNLISLKILKKKDQKRLLYISDMDSDRETGKYKKNEFGNLVYPKNKSNYNKKYLITAFGKMKNGDSIAIHIINFKQHFSIKVPSYPTINKCIDKFISDLRDSIVNVLKSYNFRHVRNKGVVQISISRKVLYNEFRNGKKYPIVKFEFNNSNTMKKWKNVVLYNLLWNKSTNKIEYIKKNPTFEKKLLLPIYKRIILCDCEPNNGRLFDLPTIKATGWHKLDKFANVPFRYRRSRCKYEIVLSNIKEGLVYLPDMEFDMPNIKTLVFDIETYPKYSRIQKVSSLIRENIKSKDKLSKEELKKRIKKMIVHPVAKNGDPITNISMVFEEEYLNSTKISSIYLMLSLVPNDKEETKILKFDEIKLIRKWFKRQSWANKSNKSIDDIIDKIYKAGNKIYLINYKTEENLLMGFRKQILKHFPDFISHYNGQSFDWKYIHERAATLNIYKKLFFGLGKMIISSIPIRKQFRKTKGRIYPAKHYPKLYGMPDLDTFLLCKKKYGHMKLFTNFKLNTVAETLLNVSKVDLPYAIMYGLIKKVFNSTKSKSKRHRYNTIVSYYCLVDSILVKKLIDINSFNYDQINTSNVEGTSVVDDYNCGISKKIQSILSRPIHDKNMFVRVRYNDSTIKKEHIFAKVIEDNLEIKQKYDKLGKIKNLNYRDVRRNKFFRDYFETLGPKGAYVFPPVSGIWHYVVPIDWVSMYPNLQRSYNISHEKIPVKEKYKNCKGVTYTTVKWARQNGTLMTTKIVVDLKNRKKENMGIIPQVQEHLLNTRKKYKDQMKKYVNAELTKGKSYDNIVKDAIYIALNATQQKYKVISNSIYGDCNMPYSDMYRPDLAGITTFGGKCLTKRCAEIVNEKWGAIAIYGDTDSIFIKPKEVQGDSEEEKVKWLFKFGQKCSDAINYDTQVIKGLNYMKIEIDDGIYKKLYLTEKKKAYFGKIYLNPNNLSKIKTKIMGFDFIKKSSCKLEKFVGHKFVEYTLNERLDEIKPFFLKLINDLYSGKYDYTYFIRGEIYKPPYKNQGTNKMCRVISLISEKDKASVPTENSKIEYVFREVKPVIGRLGGIRLCKRVDQVWPVLFLKNKNPIEIDIKIDYLIYIKFIVNTSIFLFNLIYKTKDPTLLIGDIHKIINKYKKYSLKYIKQVLDIKKQKIHTE